MGTEVDINWEEVAGSDGAYMVSDTGLVFSHKSDRLLSPVERNRRYAIVLLYYKTGRKIEYVHQLVAAAFIGPRPEGYLIDHIDGNAFHNAASNLRYVTPQGNADNMIRLGRQAKGERAGNSVLSTDNVMKILSMLKEGLRPRDIHKTGQFPCSRETLEAIKQGRIWKHLHSVEVN